MNIKKHYKLPLVLVWAVLILFATQGVQSQDMDAEQIMNQSNARAQGDDFQSTVKLISTDAQGNSSELTMELVVKTVPGSQETGKTRYNVLATVTEPEDSKGLAVLVHEQDFPIEDDIWLFLPAIGSAKKIVPENFRTPLFGSEFTFEELIDREPDLDIHELLSEDTVDDRNVWVIKSIPLDPEIAGFSYRMTFIDQTTFLSLRMELYDDFDTMIKVFSSERIESIDGILTRIISKAENLETGRVSIFEFLEPRYNQGGISDDLFDPENLGQ